MTEFKINGGANAPTPLALVYQGASTTTASANIQTVAKPEPFVFHSVTAQLPVLPEPLGLLHGPLLVTIETWSSGSIVAKLPAVALYAEGESDTLALLELGAEVLEFAEAVGSKLTAGEHLGGPLASQWRALTGLVDVSKLASK